MFSFSWHEDTKAQPYGVPLSLLAGLVLGFMHIPFFASWLSVLPLAAIFYLITREETARLAARAAFFAGLSFWAVHLFWLPQSFAQNFGPVIWAIFPLIAPLEAILFWSSIAWLAHRVTRKALPMLGFLAGGFVLTEWMRANMDAISFPWGNFGYTLLGTPLAQVSSLGGVYLASLLVTLLAAAIAALAWFEARALMVMLVLWLVALIFGLTRPAPVLATKDVLLVQPNISAFEKFTGQPINPLEIHTNLSKRAKQGALVVWSEAVVNLDDLKPKRTYLPFDPKKPNQGTILLPAPRFGKLIAGVVDYRDVRTNPVPERVRVNSVVAIQNSKVLGISTKTKLVPFSEFFPFRQQLAFIYDPILRLLNAGGAGGSSPVLAPKVLEIAGDKVGAFVCYDSIFPAVPRLYVQMGANVLVEGTNDAWFGGGIGNEQHFEMDRMRAIELDRYLLRAANTGISGVIDPRGNVIATAPQNKRLALEGKYGLQNNLTLYARFGDWAVLLSILVMMVFGLAGRRSSGI
jgi:apolipoprotein N-acyltransferase